MDRYASLADAQPKLSVTRSLDTYRYSKHWLWGSGKAKILCAFDGFDRLDTTLDMGLFG